MTTLDPNSQIARAFRITRKEPAPAHVKQGYKAPRFNGVSYARPGDGQGVAAYHLEKARAMVAAPGTIYGGEPGGKPWAQEGAGLRYVGRVVPEPRREWQDSRGDCGWHTDPYGDVFRDGSGLCFGVVYQLPARKGAARFVAGYEFGGVDGGPSLDLKNVYTVECEESAESGAYHSGAVAAADSLAQNAAEKEREYQTAWQAGSQWAAAHEESTDARRDALDLLKERRAARAAGPEFPTICATIRAAVKGHLATIRAARDRMAELAAGDYESLYFRPGDETLQNAFCEGAGLDAMPGVNT